MNEYSFLDIYDDVISYPETLVTVAASGGDYTTIKAAVAAVSPTKTAPVRIYVENGTYNEIQIIGKDWLTIEGESRSGVIVVSDGLRTDIDSISGQRYVDMAQADKSGWFSTYQMIFKNMTFRANDVKYCQHIDLTWAWTLFFDNCTIEHSNGFPVGIGLHAEEFITFNNCTFTKLGANAANGVEGSHGIFWHNWNNEASGVRIALTDCNAVNCGLVESFELGSANKDLLRMENCSTDDKANYLTVTEAYYTPPGTKAEVPYCIQQLFINSPTLLPLSHSGTDRQDADNSVYSI